MIISILQAMTLVVHGNAFLSKDYDISSYYPDNKVFAFDDKVIFGELDNKTSQFLTIANGPIEWLKHLKKDGCRLLRLFYASPEDDFAGNKRILAGMVGGGGDWWIETIFTDYSNQWFWKEDITHKEALDGKIWTITYFSSLKKMDPPEADSDTFEVVEQNLKKALTNIKQFSANQKLDNWIQIFERALMVLDGKEANSDEFNKCFPVEFCTEQFFQLAGSADIAWVFGGMGSWNDLSFDKPEDQAEYDNLSDELYLSLVLSLVYVTNSAGIT
ncbi:MAG: hypothetical protein NTV62_04270 [Candidatus Gribaldobacteria bacterium]|nr:hypothetical protein [Candidatus Gribaldobacteria bacterium]